MMNNLILSFFGIAALCTLSVLTKLDNQYEVQERAYAEETRRIQLKAHNERVREEYCALNPIACKEVDIND